MNQAASGIRMYQSICEVYNQINNNADDHDSIACVCFSLMMIPVLSVHLLSILHIQFVAGYHPPSRASVRYTFLKLWQSLFFQAAAARSFCVPAWQGLQIPTTKTWSRCLFSAFIITTTISFGRRLNHEQSLHLCIPPNKN